MAAADRSATIVKLQHTIVLRESTAARFDAAALRTLLPPPSPTFHSRSPSPAAAVIKSDDRDSDSKKDHRPRRALGEAEMTAHRPSRRQSILSVASAFFGPTALSSDISLPLDEDPFTDAAVAAAVVASPRSPSPLSRSSLADSTGRASVAAAAAAAAEHSLTPAAIPATSSPLASGRAASASILIPIVISGDRDNYFISSDHSSDSVAPTSTSATTPSSKQASRRHSSLSDVAAPPSAPRKAPIASFFGRLRALPSRIFTTASAKDKREDKDANNKPTHPRSTCTITAAQISPPANRRPTPAEKAAKRRQRAADKYIRRKTRRRLRQYQREMKAQRRQLSATVQDSAASHPQQQPAAAGRRPSRTGRLLKVVDDAKEKFWEWLDRRDTERRREQMRAHTAMREERRRSVLLVPVEREYEVLPRRDSVAEGADVGDADIAAGGSLPGVLSR